MYYTGIPACDQLLKLHITGNIIPRSWMHTIVKEDLAHPRPHLRAIYLLADIVYWYRPTEKTDKNTGKLLGYKSKFASDLLQRNYKQISDLCGCSTSQAKEAVVFLEKLGVIKRVFRDIEIGGNVYNNQMYIALDVERLKELTYPSGDISMEGGENSDRGISQSDRRGDENIDDPPSVNHRYTNNTSNNTHNISSESTPSFHHESNALNEGTKMSSLEENIICILAAEKIPVSYAGDRAHITAAINLLLDYDAFRARGFSVPPDDKETLRLCALTFARDCLIDMCCIEEIQKYKGSYITSKEIIQKINTLFSRFDVGVLQDYMRNVIDAYVDAAEKRNIRNTRKYMMTLLWDQLVSYTIKEEGAAIEDFGQPEF